MTNTPSVPIAPSSARSEGRQQVAKRREELRKAALKANMARRKAQMRGREQVGPDADRTNDPETDTTTDTDTDTDTRNE